MTSAITVDDLPGTCELTIYRERNWPITFTVLKNGVAMDLTDYEVAAQIREGKELDSTIVLTFTASHNDTGGVVTLITTKAVTKEISVSRAWWDLVLTNSSGYSRTWLEGKVTIKDAPTALT